MNISDSTRRPELNAPVSTPLADPIDGSTPNRSDASVSDRLTHAVTVRPSEWLSNPLYAFEAILRKETPHSIETFSRYGETPEQAVEKLATALKGINLTVIALIALNFATGMLIATFLIFEPEEILNNVARLWK